MTEPAGRVRPPDRTGRSPRRREVEPGGFRVRSDPNPDYSIELTVRYEAEADTDGMRAQLTEALATAFVELDRRFKSNRRPPGSSANR